MKEKKRRRMEEGTSSSDGGHAAAAGGGRSSTGVGMEDDDMMVIVPTTTVASSSNSVTAWQRTIQKAIPAIVSIRFSQVSSFDTEGAETSEATGFVVDARRGLILTNRHVACAGPFVGEAIFHDHEEVDVFPIYRDPIHDFGFLKFDPSKIQYMPVTDITLAPHLAKVGLEIRVVGNDAGEKLSILAGSISRLDRNAPVYGDLTYNDFNTFYLQAASSTSGGSSGSPVLDIHGNAVALQAGGHVKAATDFFFPLDRVARALRFLQNEEKVMRGTIQTQFYYRPFDEVRRLGLRDSTEALVRGRMKDEIGMLVIETVVPKGPAFGFLEEGDVLVSVNGEVVTKFVPLEETMDSRVGGQVTLEVERGGESLTFTINVQDLHSITPDRYLMIGGAKLNNLSYQLARSFCVPVSGVYVAEPSGMFALDGADQGWIIESLDNTPTPNIDAFIQAMKEIPDRERVPVTYYSIADVHTANVAIVSVERHWTSFRLAVRNDRTGLPKALLPSTATFAELDESLGAAKLLFHSVIKVSYYMPCRLDAGLILDSKRGLIVVGRNIVPFNMGDVSLTFADSIIIPGKVVFLHPTHNIAFISYDPALVGETPVKTPVFSDSELVQGHRVSLVALNHNQRPVCIESTVTDITSVTIPQSATPRFRATKFVINYTPMFYAITLDTPLAQQCSSGVLADSSGRVQGLWLSFLGERTTSGHDNEYYLGVSARILQPILKKLILGDVPKLRGLAVELMPIQMAQARHMGLSDSWVRRVEEANPHRRQLFMVRTMEAGSSTARVLKELDLIISVDGRVITRIHELDVSEEWGETVEMEILRQKEVMKVVVSTEALSGDGTSRMIIWAGAVMQEPHRAVLQQSRSLPSRVYVSARTKGSPSYMYGLAPTQWITQINGKETTTLDEFLEAVRGLPDNQYVRVKTISFDLVPSVLSVKNILHYWPTSELRRDSESESGWIINGVNGDTF
ncbi:trypsin-like cysteine/serine peptidase domain-containing protein [Chytridium lagenaria]|nr:trypsin-like cysteine/serine peptidase domain-containing protein [Chytridium lagenaria]